ncbi:hypothetical protein [Streptomyces atratus]|uniref:hypothetical protein n=1 Tax=Streptomyces atratus TaxID=1893 RepID=UPI0036539998
MLFLGTNNRDAVKELEKGSAQLVLDAITGIGIPVHETSAVQPRAAPGRVLSCAGGHPRPQFRVDFAVLALTSKRRP